MSAMTITNHVEEENYHPWESLSPPLLKLIMERLQFVDRLRFAAVCKRWKKAFEDSPRKELRCGPPWLLVTKTFQGNERILVDPWTSKEIFIEGEDLRNTMILGSREGWLLFATCDCEFPPSESVFWPCSPFCLYHPSTKRKIKLPESGDTPTFPISGDILMHNGVPDMVVLTGYTYINDPRPHSRSITLAIARSGSEAWEAHPHCEDDSTPFQLLGFVMVVVERNVYIIDAYNRILGFDLLRSKWTGPLGEKDRLWLSKRDQHYGVCDGDIVRVSILKELMDPANPISEFVFHKFNFSRSAWEELKEKDIQGKCWLLGGRDCKFSFVTAGVEKVHRLYQHPSKRQKSFELESYDLKAPKSTVRNVFRDVPARHASWVDITKSSY